MRTILLSALLVSVHVAHTQWTGDPAAPLVICDAPFTQNLVQARHDGAGGANVFWLDARNGRREVWGQRVSADGVSLWEPNGRPLVALPGGRHVSNFNAQVGPNGELFIAYVQSPGWTAGDTVRFARFDADGTSLIEPHPLVGGRTTQTSSTWACNSTAVLVRPDGSAFVSWTGTGRRLNIVASDGTVPQGYDGVLAINSNGVAQSKLVPDGVGGVILASMMQHGMAPFRIQRFDLQLDAQWPSDLVMPPQPGAYVNSFCLEALGNDGFFVSWMANVGQPGDLFVARFGMDGLAAWPEGQRPICSGALAEHNLQMVLRDGHLLVAWRKQATPLRLLAQKLTLDGARLWPEDGVFVEPFPASTAMPRIVGLPDGGAIITSNNISYAGHRIGPGGQVIWGAAASIATGSFKPETTWYDLLATDDNGAMTFWHNWGGDVFGARVLPGGELAGAVSIDEPGSSLPLPAWPVPADDMLRIRSYATGASTTVMVFSADGRRSTPPFIRAQDDVLQLDVSALTPGVYVAQVLVDVQRFHARFIKQ